ncbi:DUF3883 domain-containing protein [Parvibaculum sp.]|uniref:DUF3883 domain-containing protein n=1 Tax=Parvibaculum sp. TaxID=2024848 RepID=UPI001B2D7D23|nr:DUF3883 domain-containing protein [Parvibaculum sp.]MBO6667479.1 DUF3883 domain-containing protein [Parvibaculum sp.]MBO6692228.1 DUF3883 domain-containing protein [Parvibaculum sp.]MBO6714031.1 DUF3883 domain-containing protein [Parvibaculum sp.]
MSDGARTGEDWSDQEIDLIVADYFAMLEMELNGEPYVKARRNAALQDLTGRSKGSIEFKHQNISAVLQTLGEPWIIGYKPMQNFQRALLGGVERFLQSRTKGVDFLLPKATTLSEQGALFIGEAPTKIERPEDSNPHLARLVRKFDPALRDERNRQLGKLGEERVFHSERARLQGAGRDDLARKVRWVAQEDGDGAGYDILSFTEGGSERFLEVKTTAGGEQTPFYISSNEKLFSEERQDAFRIFRLYDFARAPKAFEIAPPLESKLILETANYKASFR